MELTNEEIARVFAMYWEAEVQRTMWYASDTTKKHSTNYYSVKEILQAGLNKNPSVNIGKTEDRLCAIPLSKISDEDAIELMQDTRWKMLKTNGFEVYEIVKVSDSIQYKLRKATDKIHRYKDGFEYANSFFNIKGSLAWQFQYLISKSYAVPLFFSPNHPANGKTAIELEIAIEKP